MDVNKILKTLVQRVFLLAILIAVVNTWTAAHFGKAPGQFIFANLPLAVLGIVGGFSKYLSEDEKKSISSRIRNWLLFFLLTPSLVFLWSLFILSGSFVSSVSLQTLGNQSELRAELILPGKSGKSGNAKTKVIREYNKPVPLLCNPFGKSIILKVAGYQKHYFDIYPWRPERIKIEEELTISPSVFVRIPAEKQYLIQRGWLDIIINSKKLISKRLHGQGAILIGRKQIIPGDFKNRWNLELRSSIPSLSSDEERAIHIIMKHWSVDTLYISKELNPRDTIIIRLLDDTKKVNAEAVYDINYDKIQDVLMDVR